jgi:hypothetical protein
MEIAILILAVILCILWFVKFRRLVKTLLDRYCVPVDPDHESEALCGRRNAIHNVHIAFMKRFRAVND